MGLDNCGSAQHLLLLEEFYRSATRVAGKTPVMAVNPGGTGRWIDALASALFSTGMISKMTGLDLGGVSLIPAEEYFACVVATL